MPRSGVSMGAMGANTLVSDAVGTNIVTLTLVALVITCSYDVNFLDLQKKETARVQYEVNATSHYAPKDYAHTHCDIMSVFSVFCVALNGLLHFFTNECNGFSSRFSSCC
jgi:hypothetical protein